jgi:hypothetical protein
MNGVKKRRRDERSIFNHQELQDNAKQDESRYPDRIRMQSCENRGCRDDGQQSVFDYRGGKTVESEPERDFFSYRSNGYARENRKKKVYALTVPHYFGELVRIFQIEFFHQDTRYHGGG